MNKSEEYIEEVVTSEELGAVLIVVARAIETNDTMDLWKAINIVAEKDRSK